MDSDQQLDTLPNRKPKRPTFEETLYYTLTGLSFVVMAISQHDPQLLVGSLTFGIMTLALIMRIRAIGVLALLIIISLLSVALVTQGTHQQVSSASFINALLVAIGVVAIALGSRLQKFFHDRGCRTISEFSNLESHPSNLNIWYSGGESHSASSGDWSGGNCGGDGAGGDCGG